MKNDNLPFKVKPSAERSLRISLIIFLICICLIPGFLCYAAAVDMDLDDSTPPLIALLAVVGLSLGYIIFDFGKVVINISRSLYNINDALRNGTAPKVEKNKDAEAVQNETESEATQEAKTTADENSVEPEAEETVVERGRWARVKGTKKPFCVDKIVGKEGEVKYYSALKSKYFKEDELDFD